MARQGNAKSQAAIGDFYQGLMYVSHSKFYRINDVYAFEWYSKAAAQSDPRGYSGLARLYYGGKGVLQDFEEAFKWYKLAAKQGDGRGQHGLAKMYRDGNWIRKDTIRSHMWFNIASANNYSGMASQRDELAQSMDGGDVSDAQEMARKCMSSNYKNCGW